MIFSLPFELHVVSKVIDFFFLRINRLFFGIDYQGEQWHVNPETGKRERLCSYKVTVTAVFGSSTVCSNERQVNDDNEKQFIFFMFGH